MFKNSRFPEYRQLDQMDCGPTCLKIVTDYYGQDFSLDYLRELSFLQKGGTSMEELSRALDTMGYNSFGVKSDVRELKYEIPLPAIAHWEGNHFLVIYRSSERYLYVSDPAMGCVRYRFSDFQKKWCGGIEEQGVLLLIEPRDQINDEISLKETSSSSSSSSSGYMYSYLQPYKSYLNQIFLSLLVATGIQFILPFLTQSIVDYGINLQNVSFLNLILTAQILLFLTLSLSEVIRDWVILHLSTRVGIEMVSDFLDKLMELPIAFFDSKTTGDLLQRINDHERIDNFIAGNLLLVIFDLLNIAVFSFVLLLFSKSIFAVFVVGTIVFLSWTLSFMRKKEILDHQIFGLNRREQSIFIQIFRAVAEIKLNNSVSRRKSDWKKLQHEFFKIKTRFLKTDQLQRNGGRTIREITQILIVFLSAKAVMDGTFTLGTMLAIQFVVGSLSIPVSNLFNFLSGYQKAKLSFARLSEIHCKTSEISGNVRNEAIPSHADIYLDKVCFGYSENPKDYILKDLQIIIPKGKITAIVGYSGSGKSTLFKILLKLYTPNDGSLRLNNIRFSDLDPESWRKKCGVVLQEGVIFNDTLERNITESKADECIDYIRMDHAIATANLSRFFDSLPLGYRTLVGEEGLQISGGEKQRILIARLVYKNPDYIFLDEATSSLDAENEKIISDNLLSFFAEKTVVIVAHRLSTVRCADQILLMDSGRIAEIGSHFDLIEKKGKYFNLVKNQL